MTAAATDKASNLTAGEMKKILSEAGISEREIRGAQQIGSLSEEHLEALFAVLAEETERGAERDVAAFERASTPAAVYGPRLTKGQRRTSAQIEELEDQIYDLCRSHQPLTVRNLFYLMVSAQLIDKSESDYKNVVIRLAGKLREQGALPWEWIVDNTRLVRRPDTHTGLEHLLRETARLYRRDLWHGLDEYVEVWCESDSIGGVLVDVTFEYDVPLYAQRGFGSKTFLFTAAEAISSIAKPTTIYYVGDFDPSGLVIRDSTEKRLRHYLSMIDDGATCEFEFVWLAVTPEQIAELELPTRPAKTKGNTHAKNWKRGQGTVEAEAIPPETMRFLIRDAIERHIPPGHLNRMRIIEEEERETLARIAMRVEEGGE